MKKNELKKMIVEEVDKALDTSVNKLIYFDKVYISRYGKSYGEFEKEIHKIPSASLIGNPTNPAKTALTYSSDDESLVFALLKKYRIPLTMKPKISKTGKNSPMSGPTINKNLTVNKGRDAGFAMGKGRY